MDFHQLEILKRSLTLRLKFLEQYEFLSDLYIIDFFAENHWEKLPKSWSDALSTLDPPELAKKLLGSEVHEKSSNDTVWPLSLLCFIKCSVVLSLPRNQSSCYSDDEATFKRVFYKHVSPKKQHEIKALARKIKQVHKEQKCTTIIDVGSGQGHLSRFLSTEYDMSVVALEHEVEFIERAKKFDLDLEKNFKTIKANNHLVPSHVSFTVLPDVKQDDFAQVVQNNSTSPTSRCLLTGLHACGDLSATMTRLFVESPCIQSLISVSCCYIKLTTDSGDLGKQFKAKSCVRNKVYYPMSVFTKGVNHHQLKYRALKLACHGIENLKETLANNDPRLRTQCYRAVLEYIITKKHPDLKHQAVKTIKNAHLLSFHEYAKVALNKLHLNFFDDTDLNQDEIRSMLKQNNKVIAVFTLAFMLGPVVESVILLDRMIYLAENCFSSTIESLFDPFLSPRCFAITANKTSAKLS